MDNINFKGTREKRDKKEKKKKMKSFVTHHCLKHRNTRPHNEASTMHHDASNSTTKSIFVHWTMPHAFPNRHGSMHQPFV
jgi:hypothetical protein